MKKKSIIIVAIAATLLLSIVVAFFLLNNKSSQKNVNSTNDGEFTVVTTFYVPYDITKQIVGDSGTVELLMKPGTDIYNYEPTKEDIAILQRADLLIYTGGELDNWVMKYISTIENQIKTLKLFDNVVKTYTEEIVDGMEVDENSTTKIDENIWTSVSRMCQVTFAITNAVSEANPESGEEYINRMDKLISDLECLIGDIQEVANNKVRDRLLFADKFTYRYFVEDYSLKYNAAFLGSSTKTDPSEDTITYLSKIIKDENIPVIFYTELSDDAVAKSIAKETGITAMQLQSLNSVSQESINDGDTYITLMKRNFENIKKALQ